VSILQLPNPANSMFGMQHMVQVAGMRSWCLLPGMVKQYADTVQGRRCKILGIVARRSDVTTQACS
jgi:hypothetical protein